jgi:hypothetical protein
METGRGRASDMRAAVPFINAGSAAVYLFAAC